MTHSSLASDDRPSDRSTVSVTEERSSNWAYRLVPAVCVLFIVNILGMLATTMADPSVEINRRMSAWFDRSAPISIPVFVLLIVGLIAAGFQIDRRQARRQYERQFAAWEARMAAKGGPLPGDPIAIDSVESET
jgi:hypothetical protein